MTREITNKDGLRILLRDPQIEVVGIEKDDRNDVWKISRPHLKVTDKELMDIRRLDLPIHSFAYYTFKISGSLLIRDLLHHVRPISAWSRSDRTTPITKDTFFFSSEYEECLLNDPDLEKKLDEYTDQNVSLDIRKDYFPYAKSTEFCVGMDFRTLVSFLRSLSWLNEDLFKIYGTKFLSAINLSWDELPPTSNKMFDGMQLNKVTEHTNIADMTKVVVDPEFDTCQIQYVGKGALLSQFIRQHYARVRSSFITHIAHAKSLSDLYKLTQSDFFVMQSITTQDLAKKLISTRACYFAKLDMQSRSSWSDIVTTLIKAFGGDLEDWIPCKGELNNCPFKTEQLARCIAGNPNGSKGEVNPPCSIITGLPETVAIRKLKFGSNSSLFRLWEDWADRSKLTLTKYGAQYLINVTRYGFAEKCDNDNKEMVNLICQLTEQHWTDEEQMLIDEYTKSENLK